MTDQGMTKLQTKSDKESINHHAITDESNKLQIEKQSIEVLPEEEIDWNDPVVSSWMYKILDNPQMIDGMTVDNLPNKPSSSQNEESPYIDWTGDPYTDLMNVQSLHEQYLKDHYTPPEPVLDELNMFNDIMEDESKGDDEEIDADWTVVNKDNLLTSNYSPDFQQEEEGDADMDLSFISANGPEDNQIILYEAGIQIPDITSRKRPAEPEKQQVITKKRVKITLKEETAIFSPASDVLATYLWSGNQEDYSHFQPGEDPNEIGYIPLSSDNYTTGTIPDSSELLVLFDSGCTRNILNLTTYNQMEYLHTLPKITTDQQKLGNIIIADGTSVKMTLYLLLPGSTGSLFNII